jgi:hypothetical protein
LVLPERSFSVRRNCGVGIYISLIFVVSTCEFDRITIIYRLGSSDSVGAVLPILDRFLSLLSLIMAFLGSAFLRVVRRLRAIRLVTPSWDATHLFIELLSSDRWPSAVSRLPVIYYSRIATLGRSCSCLLLVLWPGWLLVLAPACCCPPCGRRVLLCESTRRVAPAAGRLTFACLPALLAGLAWAWGLCVCDCTVLASRAFLFVNFYIYLCASYCSVFFALLVFQP